jgi:hypothetical protein
VIRTCAIVSAIAFPIVVLRYLSRRVISTYIWWDDWFAVIAVVRSTGERTYEQPLTHCAKALYDTWYRHFNF